MDSSDEEREYDDEDPTHPSTSSAVSRSTKRRRIESVQKPKQMYKPLSAFGLPKWTQRSNREGHFEYDIAPITEPLKGVQKDLVDNLKDKSPMELFSLFFDIDVLTMIVDETNLYAQQQNSEFRLHHTALKQFLGILVLSGYHRLPSVRDYWSKHPSLGVDIVKQCMTRNRFCDIKRYIHFSNNLNLDKKDKMAKVCTYTYFVKFQIEFIFYFGILSFRF